MARWQWTVVGVFVFITLSLFAALIATFFESPAPLPTPTRTSVPTFTPTGTPRPTPILMPTRPATASPTVTHTPIATSMPSTRSHTVQSGETLASIAERYGVTVEEIVALNKLSNPNVLEVGQALLIPPP